MEEFADPAVHKPVHKWLKKVNIAFAPGQMNSLLERFSSHLLDEFEAQGHVVQDSPDNQTDVIFTTRRFGEPLSWREALLFTARRQFELDAQPTIITIVHIMPDQMQRETAKLERALASKQPKPSDYAYPGLAPTAYHVLHEQGRRGGPLLTLVRVVQGQTKSIRNLLLVGDGEIEALYHFDLVGAFPKSEPLDGRLFYHDIVTRVVTTLSTREITDHQVVEPPVEKVEWAELSTPQAMRVAGKALGERHFFTNMVVIADLVRVPALSEAVSSQYSEGCFATWDLSIDALIATVTGSARPVDKGKITEADLAVITGIRPDQRGALVRHVRGKVNDAPSSEAVEMIGMDGRLPRVKLSAGEWGRDAWAPVIRSKLHGHRGVAGYDPEHVEHVRLEAPYYHYPVSCATEAQAIGIIQAFARSQALNDPDDPRQIVFTVLPGHGVVIAEKWVAGKAPFEHIWELMDSKQLQIDKFIPQGEFQYKPGLNGRHYLRAG